MILIHRIQAINALFVRSNIRMRVKSIRIRLVAFILVESLVIIVVVHVFLSSSKKNHFEQATEMTRDYVVNQPEVEENEPVIMKKIPEQIRNVNIYSGYEDPLDVKGHTCVQLKTSVGFTPICVYPREKDNMISAYVTDFHTWEEDWLNSTAEILRKHSDFVYLDLGCNIGVYTLFVAKLGAKVYALDPNIDNLRLLKKSLDLGKLQEHVTLILNAISDKHETVSLEISKGNIGGSMIKSFNKTKGRSSEENTVETVTLDDLSALLKDQKVFIKMDIESYELNAIRGAHKFFQTTDIRYIQMEWTHFRYNEKGQIIIDSLVKHGLVPYADVRGKQHLHPESYYSWPENIVWIKR